ncbi:hypothetical protein QL285_003922 [Trifolium repens]|nr:hypothetical protein QL285_003922 [Trifolium repens]
MLPTSIRGDFANIHPKVARSGGSGRGPLCGSTIEGLTEYGDSAGGVIVTKRRITWIFCNLTFSFNKACSAVG